MDEIISYCTTIPTQGHKTCPRLIIHHATHRSNAGVHFQALLNLSTMHIYMKQSYPRVHCLWIIVCCLVVCGLVLVVLLCLMWHHRGDTWRKYCSFLTSMSWSSLNMPAVHKPLAGWNALGWVIVDTWTRQVKPGMFPKKREFLRFKGPSGLEMQPRIPVITDGTEK